MRRFRYMMLAGAVMAAIISAYAAPVQNGADIVRGAYIVTRVSMCTDCHSPRLKNGQLDPKRQLAGAKIMFKPTMKMEWADIAPNLTPAGITRSWSNLQLARFLMTGKAPSGHFADPPMPQYRLNQEDAYAVTAYLRSLPPVKSTDPTGRIHQH